MKKVKLQGVEYAYEIVDDELWLYPLDEKGEAIIEDGGIKDKIKIILILKGADYVRLKEKAKKANMPIRKLVAKWVNDEE